MASKKPLEVQGSSRVQFGRTLIVYQIKRSTKRGTVSLAIDPELGLIVTAPQGVTVERLDKLVHEKGPWILQRLKRRSDLPPPIPKREFVSGETYRYLGRQYRLKVQEEPGHPGVRLKGAYLTLTLEKGVTGEGRIKKSRKAIVGWYRQRAREYLGKRAAPWAKRLGLEEPKLTVGEPKTRWGSSSKRGAVRINWRIMQAPASLVDYVLAHELVHLIHENHSREYWATLGRVMPDYEARKKRLREMGPDLIW